MATAERRRGMVGRGLGSQVDMTDDLVGKKNEKNKKN